MVVLYGNDAFSILVFSTKKRYSSFLKKVVVFQKICFKFKVLTTFKMSTNCHIKTCRSHERRAILKIPSTVFQKNLCSFHLLSNETSKNAFSSVKTNTDLNFDAKLSERSIIHFYCLFDQEYQRAQLSNILDLMNHMFQTTVLFNTVIEFIELN